MGVLRCDHPDIEAFIHAKDGGDLRNFNISVACTDAFMEAVRADQEWELVHAAAPVQDLLEAGDGKGGYRRGDGLWVYRTVAASELFEAIMRSTYDHAEPGVFFVDAVNRDNNLSYCESIASSNPCAEQPLPPYGCCDLGSINLCGFVIKPFTDQARFDFERFAQLVPVAVRMLDNVLDITVWPLEKQAREAQAKRRIGLGFTGLGDTLIMLGLRYDSEAARQTAADIARAMRDAAYGASVDLAQEKGAFPAFDAQQMLAGPRFASRLSGELQARIREHGLRNSHLLSIAPTGTISLAFADNASNGIEPAFSWFYTRKKRSADQTGLAYQEYRVEDHAWRLFRAVYGLHGQVELQPFDPMVSEVFQVEPGEVFDHGGKLTALLSEAFVGALQLKALDHVLMCVAVQPFIDTSISKTVNVPADYPYQDFKDLYLMAWRYGLKGITTYRPNDVLGAVLETSGVNAGVNKSSEQPNDLDLNNPDRRIRLERTPTPPLASLRWPGRPQLPNGNPCWTYSVQHSLGHFAVFVGHIDNGEGGRPYPFEVWVNGSEQPRGLGAIAKTLSMDMRADDRAWLQMKLNSLAKATGDDAFELPMPPRGAVQLVPSLVAGFAKLIQYRCGELGAFDDVQRLPTPVVDALIGLKEPKAGVDGTMSWTGDVFNPVTGDDFSFFLKELVMPDGQRRPYSLWLSGEYPRVFDGLCKALSMDMWVLDAAWIGMKLRKLLSYGEVNGSFMERMPGSRSDGQPCSKQRLWPSTIAYLAQLVIHRYAMLGILTESGYPVRSAGILDVPESVLRSVAKMGAGEGEREGERQGDQALAGKRCGECSNKTLIRKDGCEFCTSCGAIGSCG
jgi:ribonucleoside-diphosphate reductase alpha chain